MQLNIMTIIIIPRLSLGAALGRESSMARSPFARWVATMQLQILYLITILG